MTYRQHMKAAQAAYVKEALNQIKTQLPGGITAKVDYVGDDGITIDLDGVQVPIEGRILWNEEAALSAWVSYPKCSTADEAEEDDDVWREDEFKNHKGDLQKALDWLNARIGQWQ